MSLNIYYIGPFEFPIGGAAARRILGNINTLQSFSNVTVIDGKSINCSDTVGGVKVVSVSERPKKTDNLFVKVKKYFSIGRKTIDYIDSRECKPDIIVLYSGYSPYLLKLIPYCKKNNIKLVFDCVEWYQPKNSYEYFFKPYYWNIEIAMRYLIPKCDGVICISKYLENYYSQRGLKVINVPPTLSISSLPKKGTPELTRRIKLVYCGNPGHKDSLDTILNIVSRFKGFFELDIAGVQGNNTENIKYHGQLSHENSIDLVSKSHFSILFRPDNKIAKAGFSTKVVESMSCGTPVITNNTGDLSYYIGDDVNGYIFEGFSGLELYSKLKNLSVELTQKKYDSLVLGAISTSKEYFDSKVYSKKMKSFFDLI